MNRLHSLAAAAACVVVFLLPASVRAQLNNASAIRGVVKDAQGQPVPGVNVELEFKGESRVKIVKKTVTDKKGGYIYSGLLAGPWTFRFSKAGYKTSEINTSISLGGLSDIPPVTMQEGADDGAAAAAAIAGGAVPIAAPSAGPGASAARIKELSDKYTSAIALMKAKSYPESEALLKELLAAAPGFAPAHQALALLYSSTSKAAEAEAEYRRVVELSPEDASAHIALSSFLSSLNRHEDAFKILQEAAPRFPQHALLQFALGATAFNLGRNDDARAAFLKAAELDPANAEPHFYLGSLALSGNDVPKAVEHLEKYVSLAPAGAPNLVPARSLLETLKKKK